MVAAKLSLRQVAAELNQIDVKTPRGEDMDCTGG